MINILKKLKKIKKIENIIYEDNSKYYGLVKHGKPNGYGVYTHSNGDKDIGEWKDGKMCGQGQRLFTPMKETEENKYPNITFEEGIFENDTLQKGMRNTYFVNNDGAINLSHREVGIFKNDFFVEGSETVFDLDRAFEIRKEIGKWRYDKEKNFCEEDLAGEGEQLYYKNEEDLIKNKPLGYVKGIFDNGTLIKGEVFNAFEIDYSDQSFVKKIIIKGSSKKKFIQLGEVFFENGDRYEGEMQHDMPQGIGTMHYKDGTYLKGEWVDGNLKEEKTT